MSLCLLIGLWSTAFAAAANNFGTWYYDNGLYKYGSRASIRIPSGQSPANGEAVVHRVGSQANGEASALQAGIQRTNNRQTVCGSSENGWEKYAERVDSGFFSCQAYGTATAGNDVKFAVYRASGDSDWRAAIANEIKGTWDLGFGRGIGYMGSEIAGGDANDSNVDVRYCDDVTWNVFDNVNQGSSITVNSSSEVSKFEPGSGWTYGNLPCGVRIEH